MNPAKWSVRKVGTHGIYGVWAVWPPYPTDQQALYPTWRQAFDAADRLARGISA